jgi:hypothetical protein
VKDLAANLGRLSKTMSYNQAELVPLIDPEVSGSVMKARADARDVRLYGSQRDKRHAIHFGSTEINLHAKGKGLKLKAGSVQVGSGDLCFTIN